MGRCHRGNGTRILLLTDGRGTPLTAYTTAANHHEVNTIETLVDDAVPLCLHLSVSCTTRRPTPTGCARLWLAAGSN